MLIRTAERELTLQQHQIIDLLDIKLECLKCLRGNYITDQEIRKGKEKKRIKNIQKLVNR